LASRVHRVRFQVSARISAVAKTLPALARAAGERWGGLPRRTVGRGPRARHRPV